jgi:hypothetical protein
LIWPGSPQWDLKQQSRARVLDLHSFGVMGWPRRFQEDTLAWLLPRMCCVCTRNKGTPKIASTLCYAVDDESRSEVKERRDLLNIYDKLKGKADHFGQLYKGQYPIGTHENWLVVLLTGWFYFSLTNSYILYNTKYRDLTHKEFVLRVAEDLLAVK